MPTKAQHEAVIKAAMGGTLVPYISSQHGGGFWSSAWKWAGPVLANAARAAGASFLKHSKSDDFPTALRKAANDGLGAG